MFPLTHFDRDTFTFVVDKEPPGALTGATFVIEPDGSARALVLDYFAPNGQQEFSRVGEG